MTGATLDDIYHATIMDRARRPRHQGRLSAFEREAEARNPLCGDRISVQVARGAEGRITALGYQARACAICMASADLMAEMVPGMTAAEVRAKAEGFEAALRERQPIPPEDPGALFQPLSSVPSRIGCATLGWQALCAALAG